MADLGGEPSFSASTAAFLANLESGQNNYRDTAIQMEPLNNGQRDAPDPSHGEDTSQEGSKNGMRLTVPESIANVQQKQYELAKLEKDLEILDQRDYDDEQRRFCLSSIEFDQELDTERQGLIKRIEEKLERYDALLERERRLSTYARPTRRNHVSLIHYIWNKKSFDKSEVELFNRPDDIIIMSPEQDSFFHVWLESFLQKYTFKWLQQRFVSPIQREQTQDSTIQLYSKERIGALIHFIILIITVALVMIPVCVLFIIRVSDLAKFFIVLVFVLIFPIALSVFSKAKSHELIAATAAYTAVLVVFLQNVTIGVTPNNGESTVVS